MESLAAIVIDLPSGKIDYCPSLQCTDVFCYEDDIVKMGLLLQAQSLYYVGASGGDAIGHHKLHLMMPS